MKYNKVFLTEENWAVVGVAEGPDGKEQRSFLRHQELAGNCKLERTDNVVLHEDGRQYRDVVILRIPGGENPDELANLAWAYHPDNKL